MSTANVRVVTTIQAGEALASAQYHAIAFADGQLATNGEEASGILLNEPANNEFASVGILGEMKFAAGGAITKGAKLSVTTSGWFTSAGSKDAIVGECKYTITSGSVGTGVFNFATGQYQGAGWVYPVTAAAVATAGCAFDLSDMKIADSAAAADGVVITTAALSGTTDVAVGGIVTGLMGGGAATAGMSLEATTSGYFIAASSGDMVNARALAAITSGSTGAMAFYGVGYTSA